MFVQHLQDTLCIRLKTNDPLKTVVDKKGFKIEDWKKICDAVWYNNELVELNCKRLKLSNYKKLKSEGKETRKKTTMNGKIHKDDGCCIQ